MPASLVNLGAGQRLDLSDVLALSQDQPTALLSGVLGRFASQATAQQALYVLHGFKAAAGVGTSTTNPAANQLLVSPGAGILAWRRDAGAPRFGVMADLDGTDQAAQSCDFTYMPSGTYRIWLRMTYAPGAETDRTFWNAADPGYEFSQLQKTRLVATWEIQALASGANPGAEWVAVAQVKWTAPSTQGAAGSLTGLLDTRPLYFEGRADSTTPFASDWGAAAADRSADRGTNGVSDLYTALSALRTCIEDVKGPGLRRWWDSSIGGLNVGFGPNTPTLGRVAVGDSGTYLQGRTAASPVNAFLVGSQAAGAASFDGFIFGSDRQQWTCKSAYPYPAVTLSQYGTLGVGNLAGVDLFSSPNRALVEIVTSSGGQSALRLGARAYNNTVPCVIDTVLNVVAPDQAGNLAEIFFSRGGVQGPEQTLYLIGKGASNNFHLFDNVNKFLVLDYAYTSRSLTLSGGDFTLFDVTGAGVAWSYSSSARNTTIAQKANIGGTLTLNNDLVVGTFARFGGLVTLNGGATVNGSLSASGPLNSPSFSVIGGSAKLTPNRLIVGSNQGAPAVDAPFGTIYYDPDRAGGRFYCYTKQAWLTDNNGQDEGQDGLPGGWRRIQVG